MQLTPFHLQKLEQFLTQIQTESYPEPASELHTNITQQMLDYFIQKCGLVAGMNVLDVGCGQGVALKAFTQRGFHPVGITLNPVDRMVCHQQGYMVHEMDQSFLEFDDRTFDIVWCRHCLEHSIFPYFTLHEIFRVLKPQGVLYVEVPAPDTSSRHQSNPNHYSVMGKTMWAELMHRTGFELLDVADIKFQTKLGEDVYWAFVQRKASSE